MCFSSSDENTTSPTPQFHYVGPSRRSGLKLAQMATVVTIAIYSQLYSIFNEPGQECQHWWNVFWTGMILRKSTNIAETWNQKPQVHVPSLHFNVADRKAQFPPKKEFIWKKNAFLWSIQPWIFSSGGLSVTQSFPQSDNDRNCFGV